MYNKKKILLYSMALLSFHEWFLNREFPQGLKDYMQKYNLLIDLVTGYRANSDIQTLYFSFIRAVPVELLPYSSTVHQNRVDRIDTWADEDSLLRMPFIEYTPWIIGKKIHLPRISLEKFALTSDNWMNPPKYNMISDGNHRLAKAIEIGMTHVLCEVMETFEVKRDEMGEVINIQKNYTYYSCKFCEKAVLEIEFHNHFFDNHGVEEIFDEYCNFCQKIIPMNDFDHLRIKHPKEFEKIGPDLVQKIENIEYFNNINIGNFKEELNFKSNSLDEEKDKNNSVSDR